MKRLVSAVLVVGIWGSSQSAWARAPWLVDPTFGNGGLATAAFGTAALGVAGVLTPDGKIVVAGSADGGGQTRQFAIARFNADGTADATFGTNGAVTTRIADVDRAEALVVQPDNKIVAVGLSGTLPIPYVSRIALARYDTDGTLDATFGSGGVATVSLQPGSAGLGRRSAVLQPDGRIVVGAYYAAGEFALLRFNSDGGLDATFGSGGIAGTVFPTPGELHTLALQPDGKLVAAGALWHPSFVLVRYNSDGSLDGSFGNGGIVLTDFGPQTHVDFRSMLVEPDGKLLTAGTLYDPSQYSASTSEETALVMRFNSDGSFDPGWGGNGRVVTHLSFDAREMNSYASTAVSLADGNILASGNTAGDGLYGDTYLMRYHPDGSLDDTFGTDGIVRNSSNDVGSIAALLQPTAASLVSVGSWIAENYWQGGVPSLFGLVRYSLLCGNGQHDAGEECDDGNMTDADGCEGDCTLPRCGNGIIDPGEACDDGNLSDGDACEAACTLPACGNGIVDAGEDCDDGNLVDADGCDSDCVVRRIAGGGATGSDCLTEWLVANRRSGARRVPATQHCRDNDPRCDFDGGAPGGCTFHVSVCASINDPSLRRCQPEALAGFEVLRPSAADAARSADAATAQARLTEMAQAMRTAPGGTCAAPVAISVPLRIRGSRLRASRLLLKTAAIGMSGKRDTDRLSLVCDPPTPPPPRAYITGPGTSDAAGDAFVAVVNTASNHIMKRIGLSGSRAFGIALNPDASYAYVTEPEDDLVAIIDTATNSVAATARVRGPVGLDVSDVDGRFVYIAQYYSGSVAVLDTTRNRVSTTIALDASCHALDVALTHDGRFAYVAGYCGSLLDPGTVWVVDTSTNSVVAPPITVTPDPSALAITPDGRSVYVGGWDLSLSVIDTATNTVAATVSNASGYPMGMQPVVTPDAGTIYVGGVVLSAIDPLTNAVTGTFDILDPMNPRGMAISGDGRFLYATTPIYEYTYVIDVAQKKVVAKIPIYGNRIVIASNP